MKPVFYIKTLNAELNPICHLLALLGAHHILHLGTIRVNGIACGSQNSAILTDPFIDNFKS